MTSFSDSLARECAHCGSFAAHFWLVVDAAEMATPGQSPELGTALCSACGQTSELGRWQVVTNLHADGSSACVVVVPSEEQIPTDRNALEREVAVGVQQWCELHDLANHWNFVLVGLDNWPAFYAATVDPGFSWTANALWETLPHVIQYELHRASLADYTLRGVLDVARAVMAGNVIEVIEAAQRHAEALVWPTVFQSVRRHLREQVLLFGEESLPGHLDALVVDLGSGVSAPHAIAHLESRLSSSTVSGDLPAVQLFLDPDGDLLDRASVAHPLLALLQFDNAPTSLLIAYWRARTDLARDLRDAGKQSAQMAHWAAERWLEIARRGGDDSDIAAAAAGGGALIIEDGELDLARLARCELLFNESLMHHPIEPDDDVDHVRWGNVLQVRALRVVMGPDPDFRPILGQLSDLLSRQRPGADRAYNLARRGRLRLDATLLSTPQADLQDAIGDLEVAAMLASRFDLEPRVQFAALVDLAEARGEEAGRATGEARETACQRALKAVRAALALEPQPPAVVVSRGLATQAQLLSLLGRTSEAYEALRSALRTCPLSEFAFRRVLAQQLGDSAVSARDWSAAADAYATACAVPDGRPSLPDLVNAGRGADWRPDLAARSAAFAYARAGKGQLAVEFLESALARQAALDVKLREVPSATSALLQSRFPHQSGSFGDDPRLAGAVRIPFAALASRVRSDQPVVYVNPHPTGTATTIVFALDDIEILITEEVTGRSFASWAIGDVHRSGSFVPGLMLEHDLPMLSTLLARALPTVGDAVMRDLALVLRRRGVERITLICAGYARGFPLHAAPFDLGRGVERLSDTVDVAMAPALALIGSVRQDAAPEVFVGVADSVTDDLPELRGARTEVLTAAQLFDERCRTTLLAEDATAENLALTDTGGCVLHLSVHTRENGTLLVLSDEGVPALRLPRLLPAVPALVFAACCSSAADTHTGAIDEANQLPTAMLEAGCPAIIVSLWPVADVAAALVVGKFYQLHREDGLSVERSLRLAAVWLRGLSARDAHRELLQVRRASRNLDTTTRGFMSDALHGLERLWNGATRPFSDPIYWAPFVMFGALRSSQGRSTT